MSYFTSRLELMVLGQRPYTDFDFFYGPLLIYPQFWLYHLGAGLLSVEQAYGTLFILQGTAGLYLFYFVFRKLRGQADLTLPFLCILAPSLVGTLAMGLNYTFHRYRSATGTSRSSPSWGAKVHLVSVPLVFVATLLIFLISPEMGVAALLALLAYFVLQKEFLSSIAALAGVIFLFGFYYFEGLINAGSGGADFPLFPTIHLILYLAALILILPYLAANEWHQRNGQAGLGGAFFVLAAATIPAALGRCDAGHVFFDGLTIFILALALAANCSVTWLRRMNYGCFATAFFLIAAVSFSGHYDHKIILALKGRWTVIKQRDAYWHLAGMIHVEHPRLIFSKPVPRYWSNLDALKKYDSLGTPLTFEIEVDHYLKMSDRYTPSYRNTPIEILNQECLDEQIATIKNTRHILVPETYSPILFSLSTRRNITERTRVFSAASSSFPSHSPVGNIHRSLARRN